MRRAGGRLKRHLDCASPTQCLARKFPLRRVSSWLSSNPCTRNPRALYHPPNSGVTAKLDGYRCLAAKQSSSVVLWSRRGNDFTTRFSDIARACDKLPPDTLIDGEVAAVDENGRLSFNALQQARARTHKQFYAFDILTWRDRSILRLPLETRREALSKVEYPVILSNPFDAKPADLIRAAKELELEGYIAKRKGHFMSPVGVAALGSSTRLIARKNLLLADTRRETHSILLSSVTTTAVS